MPDLFRKSDGTPLGTISDEDFQYLVDHLEEESITDEDYTMDRLTLEYLKGEGISQSLLKVLEAALGDANEVEIRYTR